MKEKFNFKSEEFNFSNPAEARLFFLLRLLIKKKIITEKYWTKVYSNQIQFEENKNNHNQFMKNWLSAFEKILLANKTLTEFEIENKIQKIEISNNFDFHLK